MAIQNIVQIYRTGNDFNEALHFSHAGRTFASYASPASPNIRDYVFYECAALPLNAEFIGNYDRTEFTFDE